MTDLELSKPESCPKCDGTEIRQIMYGLPTQETLDRVERGEVQLGGCMIFDDMPDWVCRSCGHQWFDPNDPARIERDELLERIRAKADEDRKSRLQK